MEQIELSKRKTSHRSQGERVRWDLGRGVHIDGVSEGRVWTGVTEHGDGVTDGVTEHGDGGKHKFPVTQQAAG